VWLAGTSCHRQDKAWSSFGREVTDPWNGIAGESQGIVRIVDESIQLLSRASHVRVCARARSIQHRVTSMEVTFSEIGGREDRGSRFRSGRSGWHT
jgi:hypothetical protein